MGRLFVSYASEDEELAKSIVGYFEQHGVLCWAAFKDIEPRTIYAEAIAIGVRDSSACAVILSEAANRSDAIKRELELASHNKRPFIPIKTDDSELGAGLDYYLRNTQWFDYHRHGQSALDRIVTNLGVSSSPPDNEQDASPLEQPTSAVEPPPRVATTNARRGSTPVFLIGGAALIAIIALWAALPKGQSTDGYPPGIEMNFMRACEAQSTVPGLCACTWDKIETEVTASDFQALELLPGPERLAHPLSQQISGYALACGQQLSQQPPGEPAGGQ